MGIVKLKGVKFSFTYNIKFCFVLLLLAFSGTALGQSFPAGEFKLVWDEAKVLKPLQIQELELKLSEFDKATSTQIVVMTLKTTNDYDIADYADRLAADWGIGTKKHNNGILVLAAIDDRAVTIRTGYGIEGAVPDIIAHRIIEKEIKPAFREGDYYKGLDNAVNALILNTKGEYNASPETKVNPGAAIIVIIVSLFVLSMLVSKNKDTKVISRHGTGFGGGRFGGGGGFGGGGFGGGGASGRW